MIDPSECFAAPISAAQEMTLVLPRGDYEHRCLIVMSEGKPVVVCLDELHQLGRFFAFECDGQNSWNGLHIPGVRIELDEASLSEAQGHFIPRGTMERSEDKLSLRVQFERRFHSSASSITILDGLRTCAAYQSACFLKWQIVLGVGEEKRVLATVDATPITN